MVTWSAYGINPTVTLKPDEDTGVKLSYEFYHDFRLTDGLCGGSNRVTRWLQFVLGTRYDSFDPSALDQNTNILRNRSDDKVSPRAAVIMKPIENLSFRESFFLRRLQHLLFAGIWRSVQCSAFRQGDRELSASRQSPSSKGLMTREAMPPLGFLPPSIATRGRDDPETVKLTGIHHNLIAAGPKQESSLGAIPEMLYYNSEWLEKSGHTPVKAHAGMKWFRSNIRLMSRLALFALAIQFLLSFGHFHGSSGQAAPARADAKQWALHDAVSFATTHALNRASHEDAYRAVPPNTSSDHESDGRPNDGCAICAVLALADTLTIATPYYLLGPQPAAFSYLIADAGSTHLNSAGVAFQPRAPPFC